MTRVAAALLLVMASAAIALAQPRPPIYVTLWFDTEDYILTGLDLLDSGRRPAAWPLDRDPLPLETSRPCVFTAGDVRYGSTKRVAGAVGDGAMAVALAYRCLEPRATDD